MNKIKLAVIAFVALVGIMMVVPSHVVLASAASQISGGVNAVASDSLSLGDRIQQGVNIMLYLLGAIAVVMIVIGGIRYTTSNGESSQIKSAKDTILYAIIGLVVAILAYAIVHFVVGAFK